MERRFAFLRFNFTDAVFRFRGCLCSNKSILSELACQPALAESYGRRASRSLLASESFGLACRAVARSIVTCEGRCSARLRCATTQQPSLSTTLRAKAGGEGRNRTRKLYRSDLTHSVTRLILALFHAGSSTIYNRSTTTFHCSVIALVLFVR